MGECEDTMTDEYRATFCNALRDMATFLEDHPGVPCPMYTGFNEFVTDKAEIVEIARAASWAKRYDDTWFALRLRFCDDLYYDINIHRNQVCRKVVTGTREVPARPAVEAHIEDTCEWVCDDALLAHDAESVTI